MPTYNRAKLISESINSILEQTYQNWELIIIDDGSSDDTRNIVNNYIKQDDRIKYYYQANAKQGAARNNGISKSKGEWIAFLDSDDLWVCDKLQIQTDYLSANKQTELLFSSGYLLYEYGSIENFYIKVKSDWSISDLPLFINSNQVPILSVIVKRDCLEGIGGFDEDPNIQNVEDYFLWINLLIDGRRFASIPEKLFYYRVHGLQSTKENGSSVMQHITLYKKLYNKNKDDVIALNILNSAKWGLFKTNFSKEYSILCYQILNTLSKVSGRFFMLTRYCPSQKLTAKLQFKIINSFLNARNFDQS